MSSEQVRNLLRKVGRAFQRPSPTPAKRHANPYATHLPVLLGLDAIYRFQRVVEFGSGLNSTVHFSNSELFPAINTLISFENDMSWADIVIQKAGSERLQLVRCDGAMAEAVTPEAVAGADVILVDDSTNAATRSETIRRVLEHAAPETLVVIHDFEVRQYQEASVSAHHRFVFDALKPHTGLITNRKLPQSKLRRLNALIKKAAPSIELTDVTQWRDYFRQELA